MEEFFKANLKKESKVREQDRMRKKEAGNNVDGGE